MIFSSIPFLFFFLPGALLLFFAVPRHRQSFALLVASLLFSLWGEGTFELALLGSIGVNFLYGRLLAKNNERHPARGLLLGGVFLNLALLAGFKYAPFFAGMLNPALVFLHLPPLAVSAIHIPLGISFFTFQAIAYLVDIFRHKTRPAANLVDFALYLSFFPVTLAGPILRYPHFIQELAARQCGFEGFSEGVQRFILGLAKKVLLATPLALLADQIFTLPAPNLSPALAWLGALCYTLQIYYDFSGYSDMAIGIARLFGIRIPENFNYPYIARSIRDFWRRWHISLSSWLRDYLYIPLGGSRNGTPRTLINLLVSFLLCGLWHGASWNFILWGGYHGVFLLLERSPIERWRTKTWPVVQQIQTLVIVMVGWVFFRSLTLADAWHFLLAMAGAGPHGPLPLAQFLDKKALLDISFALFFALPVLPTMQQWAATLAERAGRWNQAFQVAIQLGRLIVLGGLFYFAAISLAAGAYSPFIYLKF